MNYVYLQGKKTLEEWRGSWESNTINKEVKNQSRLIIKFDIRNIKGMQIAYRKLDK